MSKLKRIPINLKQAKVFITEHHSHHPAPQGWKFGVGIEKEGTLVGVGVAGRPVSRNLDDGKTIEITHCCTIGDQNAASMIYGALVRAAFALGYRKAITYTLAEEEGTSLKASNWKKVERIKGRSWNREKRPRTDKAPTVDKDRWEIITKFIGE